jgi:hypothetical protein
MALWHTSAQLGIRRDIQITSFQTDQNFTVRRKNYFLNFLMKFV